jgi:hypothetical protein
VFEDQEPAAVVADDTPHYKPLFVQPNITDINNDYLSACN